jgi:hypothetical protein
MASFSVRPMADHRVNLIQEIAQDLLDQGLVVEAGWEMYRVMALPHSAPTSELDRVKEAFFAGAQHVLGPVMSALEPGVEPSETDIRRMHALAQELDRFSDLLWLKYSRPMGSA